MNVALDLDGVGRHAPALERVARGRVAALRPIAELDPARFRRTARRPHELDRWAQRGIGDWRASLASAMADDHAPVYLRPRAPVSAALRRLDAAGARIDVFTDAPEELARVALASRRCQGVSTRSRRCPTAILWSFAAPTSSPGWKSKMHAWRARSRRSPARCAPRAPRRHPRRAAHVEPAPRDRREPDPARAPDRPAERIAAGARVRRARPAGAERATAACWLSLIASVAMMPSIASSIVSTRRRRARISPRTSSKPALVSPRRSSTRAGRATTLSSSLPMSVSTSRSPIRSG